MIFLASTIAGGVAEFFYRTSAIPGSIRYFAGSVLIAGGVLLIRGSMGEITKAGTTYVPWGTPTKLVTSGPYRVSRNPGYLGLVLIQFGLAALSNSLWLVAATVPAVLLTHFGVILREEEKLGRELGEAYQRYRSSVRRWI